MMKNKILMLMAFVLVMINCKAQIVDTIFNQLDSNGLMQGIWRIMYSNEAGANIYSIGNYKNGKKNGMYKHFHKNGNLRGVEYYKNDTLHGNSIVYRLDGTIQYEENFQDGRTHGWKRYYNERGELFEEQEYVLGLPNGIYNAYSAKKNIVMSGYSVNRIEHGLRRVFADDSTHRLLKEIEFKNGVMITERIFKDGKLTKIRKYNYEAGLKRLEALRKKNKKIDG
jgi:antitoxin component YwqK of YwqJK toxin-antitoxin module